MIVIVILFFLHFNFVFIFIIEWNDKSEESSKIIYSIISMCILCNEWNRDKEGDQSPRIGED